MYLSRNHIKIKKCNSCKKYLPLDRFYNSSKSGDGKQYTCIKCMQSIKDEHRNKEPKGIYSVSFVGVEGKKVLYIGSTTQLTSRKYVHFSELKNNKHPNRILMSEFKKLVEKVGLKEALNSLEYKILEEISEIDLDECGYDDWTMYLCNVEIDYIKSKSHEQDIILANIDMPKLKEPTSRKLTVIELNSFTSIQADEVNGKVRVFYKGCIDGIDLDEDFVEYSGYYHLVKEIKVEPMLSQKSNFNTKKYGMGYTISPQKVVS